MSFLVITIVVNYHSYCPILYSFVIVIIKHHFCHSHGIAIIEN